MRKVNDLFVKLVRDEDGGELLEYALIAGLIVIAAITAIGAFGGKIRDKFTTMGTQLDSAGN